MCIRDRCSAVAWSYLLAPVIPRCNRENDYLDNTYGLITPEVSACGLWIPRPGFCISFQWTVGCRGGLGVTSILQSLGLRICFVTKTQANSAGFCFVFLFVFWQITIRLCLRVHFRANGFLVRQLNCQVDVQSVRWSCCEENGTKSSRNHRTRQERNASLYDHLWVLAPNNWFFSTYGPAWIYSIAKCSSVTIAGSSRFISDRP